MHHGRQVTPNQHALAEQFALLDNYYCNGVISADGHAWRRSVMMVDVDVDGDVDVDVDVNEMDDVCVIE